MTRLIIIMLCAASVWGQTIPVAYQQFGQIKDYLQLSDSQYQTLLSNNTQYANWYLVKQDRMIRLQVEIGQETARDKPDPLDLGLRYVEIETICRDIRQQAAVTSKMNTDMLTAQQKTKLQALEDAIKLAPVISDAQSAKLLASSALYPLSVIPAIRWFGIPGPADGCTVQSTVISTILNPFLLTAR